MHKVINSSPWLTINDERQRHNYIVSVYYENIWEKLYVYLQFSKCSRKLKKLQELFHYPTKRQALILLDQLHQKLQALRKGEAVG